MLWLSSKLEAAGLKVPIIEVLEFPESALDSNLFARETQRLRLPTGSTWSSGTSELFKL